MAVCAGADGAVATMLHRIGPTGRCFNVSQTELRWIVLNFTAPFMIDRCILGLMSFSHRISWNLHYEQ